MAEQNQDTSARFPRVIDFRIPLPWLLGICGFVCWAIISMWFALNQLVRDVSDLQITVKTGNSQAQTVAGEIALLRFRVENLEGERRLQQQQQQVGRPVDVNPLGRAK